jgi:hypothetical protein
MSQYHLAQLNVARPLAPLDSPLLADFMANLDRINLLAEQSPGFVWRLQSEEGNATSFRVFDEDTLVNLTVWEDIESLHAFVYRSAHVEIMRHRRKWFEKSSEAVTALWWIPAGHIPTLAEAQRRLLELRERGPSPAAFSFREPFAAPGVAPDETPVAFDDCCPA